MCYGDKVSGTESPKTVIVDEDEILEEAVVYYYTATDDGAHGEASSVSPIDAGRYWAEITLGSGDDAMGVHGRRIPSSFSLRECQTREKPCFRMVIQSRFPYRKRTMEMVWFSLEMT